MDLSCVSILAVGDELVDGDLLDSNSAYICSKLKALGIEVGRVSHVRDRIDDIRAELASLLASAEVVITSGGLGPTSDDLTREAVSIFCLRSLEPHSAAREKLERRYSEMGRALDDISLRQIMLPRGSERIENPDGTADAFVIEVELADDRIGCIVALPGVPHELKSLVDNDILPRLKKRWVVQPPVTVCLKFFGLSESYIGRTIESIGLGDDIAVAYRASAGEVAVKLTLRTKHFDTRDREVLDRARQTVQDLLGREFIFSEEPEQSLAQVVAALLASRGLKLAVAESCSGGLLAHRLVSIAGASRYFLGSVVSYSDEAKEVFLGVSRDLLDECGAVSRETVMAMARGARMRTGADLAVSLSGIAGPDGGTCGKPVGTLCVGLSSAEGECSVCVQRSAKRNFFRDYSVNLALDLVRRKVLGYPLDWETR